MLDSSLLDLRNVHFEITLLWHWYGSERDRVEATIEAVNALRGMVTKLQATPDRAE